MDYLVIIKTEWGFDVKEFKSLLLERWPAAHLRDLQSAKHQGVLDFEFTMNRSELYGTLYQRGRMVSFSGDLRDCIEFACWCRSMIPSGEDVMFCDESVNTSLGLEMITTPEKILQALCTG